MSDAELPPALLDLLQQRREAAGLSHGQAVHLHRKLARVRKGRAKQAGSLGRMSHEKSITVRRVSTAVLWGLLSSGYTQFWD